ncbi:restriction endonuclease S subunit [Lachnospiraceae bacterium PM6-15]|uniref:restriction endonuclease subunit S n=1 Tax=Ohessyouella blattaphilus TaxID=2949333 RepID=UPI003E1C665E
MSEHIPTDGKAVGFVTGDTLIGNIRPYLRKIWYADCDGGTNGDVLVVRGINQEIIYSHYLYHILASDDFFNYDNNNSKGAKMPRGNKDAIMQYKCSIPTIEKQKRIVGILNRFDTLCNDISTGIPAEIEARQKQYEYYRDKLLSFEELTK